MEMETMMMTTRQAVRGPLLEEETGTGPGHSYVAIAPIQTDPSRRAQGHVGGAREGRVKTTTKSTHTSSIEKLEFLHTK